MGSGYVEEAGNVGEASEVVCEALGRSWGGVDRGIVEVSGRGQEGIRKESVRRWSEKYGLLKT
jgi:hypothetical protein